jgi:hypothetical protein
MFENLKGNQEHHYVIESDSGPGGTSDPGRSLRHAKACAAVLLPWRESKKK